MPNFKLKYKLYGQSAILIEWPSGINEATLWDILTFKKKIDNTNTNEILELRSAYNSLLVVYRDTIRSYNEECELLKTIYSSEDKLKTIGSRLWKIPVCYEDCFGLDLAHLAQSKNITKQRIIQMHSQIIYTVYFIGFLPGFLYLGGLDKQLFTPRHEAPRMQVKKGAVAIGGNQTGVYPDESPGGWNIIGNSPLNFFNPQSETPCFAHAGDRIQFYPVSLKKYENIKVLVEQGVFQMESEVRDG